MPSDSSVTGATAGHCGVTRMGLSRTVHTPAQSLRKATEEVLKETRVRASPGQGKDAPGVHGWQQQCPKCRDAALTH